MSSLGVNRPAYMVARRTLKLLVHPPFRRLKGFKITGAGRLPRAPRTLILASNHAAFIDSVYWILAVPTRFTICGARPRLFRTPALRAVMRLANILKVESRRQFLADTEALLAAGETLLVYPEMGRSPAGLGELKTWAAEAALRSGAPLLPSYLYGTTRGHRGPPHLVVGHEIVPEGDPRVLTGRLRREILDLARETDAAA